MTLLWNEEGQIQCGLHTPRIGSDTWTLGRWRAITFQERIDFVAEAGVPPRCETCRAIEERHREGRHTAKWSDECALSTGGSR